MKPIWKLKKEELEQLMKLKKATNVKLVNDWFDDGVECCAVSFQDQDKRKWRFELWWVGPMVIAATHFIGDSKKAQKEFIDSVRKEARTAFEDYNYDK